MRSTSPTQEDRPQATDGTSATRSARRVAGPMRGTDASAAAKASSGRSPLMAPPSPEPCVGRELALPELGRQKPGSARLHGRLDLVRETGSAWVAAPGGTGGRGGGRGGS